MSASFLRAPLIAFSVCAALASAPVQAATLDPLSDRAFGSTEDSQTGLAALAPVYQALLLAITKAFDEGDFAKAEELAQSFVEKKPEVAQGWYMLGLSQANQNKLEPAVEALGKAGNLFEFNAEPFITQGDILAAMGRTAEASAAYEAAIKRDPANWRSFDSLGLMSEKAGDADRAIDWYAQAVQKSAPRETGVRLRMARLLMGRGDPARAAAVMADSAALDGAGDDVLEMAATAQLQAGNVDGARPILVRLADRGTSLPGFLGLASVHLAARELDEATQVLLRAQEAFPQSADVKLRLGNLYGATLQYDEALATYESGLELAPKDPALLRSASMAELRLGRMDAAIARARSLAEREGASGADLFWLGSVQQAAGNVNDAQQSYEKAIEIAPNNWPSMNNLAALLTDSDPNRAVELATKADALSPNQPAVLDTLGWAQFKAGNLDAALSIFDGLAQANPDSAQTSYRKGAVLAAKGDSDAARAALQKALELDPAFPAADEARKILSGL